MQHYFYDLTAKLETLLHGNECFKCWFSAEASDFVRFNRSAIRQPGHVRQIMLTLDLIDGRRHATCSVAMAGRVENDLPILKLTITQLREQLPDLPDDPHFLMATEKQSSESIVASQLPDISAIVDEILTAGAGLDLVGILAAGPVYRGFANSFGQRNWHETANFNLDWSLYQARDKAVKSTYAGVQWEAAVFRAKFQRAVEQLTFLKREPITVKAGAYRAYLTPTALNEIVGMFNWAGLSEKALRTKQSSLRRMRDEGLQLSPAVNLTEQTLGGLAPGFQSDGFIKPARVDLLRQGALVGSLVSPRTAMQYGVQTNGADADEAMASIDMAAGGLPMERVLAELDTGVWVSNLWYLNYSDRANCRITGMTRFATFWVEKGEIIAPLNVMRFDESLFSLLGDNLIDFTAERELLIDGESYGERRCASARLPGALVKDFTFVL